MKDKPKYIVCECGKEFRAVFWNGLLKSKQCPACNYKDMYEKAKDQLGVRKNRTKPNKIKRKSNRKNQKTNTPLKTRKKSVSRNLDNKLDEAWSELVKLRAGNRCEVSGRVTQLNSHHLFSRANKAIRWDVDNGICLTVAHHIGSEFSAHKTPITFNEWLVKYKGQEFIDKLTIKSKQTKKWTEFEKELLLKEMNKQIAELRIKIKRGF